MLANRMLAGAAGAAVGGTFSFQIVTTSSPQTFTLPLGWTSDYTQDFTIDWGDTNSSTITSYDDPDKAHEYATAGTYDCVITGVCEYFGFNNAGDKTLPKRLDGLTGDIGFKMVNFNGCSNLDYIDSTMNLWSRITNFGSCFNGCTSITTIPSGLFDNSIEATEFSNCFNGCTSITTIPSGLFDNNTAVTNFYTCFNGCTSITALPDNLILYNVAIDVCSYMFQNCSGMTSGDGTAFVDKAEEHGITTHTGCFNGAVNIPDYNLIPSDWGGGGA